MASDRLRKAAQRFADAAIVLSQFPWEGMKLFGQNLMSMQAEVRNALTEPEDATALAVRELTELQRWVAKEMASDLWWRPVINMEIDARLAKLRQGGVA